jgi:hypothetical protein
VTVDVQVYLRLGNMQVPYDEVVSNRIFLLCIDNQLTEMDATCQNISGYLIKKKHFSHCTHKKSYQIRTHNGKYNKIIRMFLLIVLQHLD